jgi:hypothetical protein
MKFEIRMRTVIAVLMAAALLPTLWVVVIAPALLLFLSSH